MNKLTKIKELVSRGGNRGLDHLLLPVEDVAYLLSLLEEKDKALEVLADKSNWFEVTDRDNAFSVLPALKAWAWMDQRLPWTIARKALNTSSNNEGD